MQSWQVLPRASLQRAGDISRRFAALGVHTYRDAGRYVHHLPYGRNSDRANYRPRTDWPLQDFLASAVLAGLESDRRLGAAFQLRGYLKYPRAVYYRARPVTPMPLDSPLEAL